LNKNNEVSDEVRGEQSEEALMYVRCPENNQ
jgi:hypothetical protein